MADKPKYFTNAFKNTFGTLVGTPIGRVQWLALSEPNRKFKPEKYMCHILFDKNDPAVKNGLNKLILQCKDIQDFVYGKKSPAFTYAPVRDADKDGMGDKYTDFKGMYYIKATNAKIPEVVDSKQARLDPKSISAGNLCRLVVTPIMFDQGFSWRLEVVQLVKDDGVRFRGGIDPKSVLEALEEEEVNTEVSPAEVGTDAQKEVATGKASALSML